MRGVGKFWGFSHDWAPHPGVTMCGEEASWSQPATVTGAQAREHQVRSGLARTDEYFDLLTCPVSIRVICPGAVDCLRWTPRSRCE